MINDKIIKNDVLAYNEIDHPKTNKLLRILEIFFNDKNVKELNSKAIIFVEDRSTIKNIFQKFESSPLFSTLIRATKFLGHDNKKDDQNKMTQKEQQEILKKFKSGTYNVLISTCIGEEGLDIGEVDLIINYDQTNNMTRNIQRRGRTGRQRKGFIVNMVVNSSKNKQNFVLGGHEVL